MVLRVCNYKINISLFFLTVVALAFAAGMYTETIAALFALGVHEFAHIFVGSRLGIVIHEIEILPFGGRIKSSLGDVSDENEILTLLAGPLANFAVVGFIIFISTFKFLPPRIAWQFIHYQLMLGIFNMLPALPLDGGRIFALWLRQRISYTSSVRIASHTGKILAYSMLLIAILGFVFKKVYFSFIISGFFLLQQASKEEKNAHLIFMKYLAKKKEKLLKNQYFPGEILVVDQETTAKKLLYLFLPTKYFIVYVLDKNMEIQKYLTETEIFDKIIEKGLDFKMKDLI